MIAPIIITVIVVLLCIAYAAMYLMLDLPIFIRIGYPVAVLLIACAMIFVLRDRIREIKGGEEDDLDNY